MHPIQASAAATSVAAAGTVQRHLAAASPRKIATMAWRKIATTAWRKLATTARAAIMLAMAMQPAFAVAAPVQILFVGNSYTFGRVDPVMHYNAANVHDLTGRFEAADAAGTNPWEPHPWGGVPGIFKQLATEKGLDYEVSISARNAISLRTHFLDAVGPAWDLRGNLAAHRWDQVVLQEQSDATLPAGFGKSANPAQFRAYADRIERYVHVGSAQSFTESELYGSLAACESARASAAHCAQVHAIPANPQANAAARIYLTQTWARPDMVFAHRITRPDRDSPDGRPIVDTRAGGGAATVYYTTLAAMTRDLHAAAQAEAQANAHFAGVIPVGDAFQLGVDQGLVRRQGFYDADGVHAAAQPGEAMDLWWDDGLHASKYGSYLDALVQFGAITGTDPRSFGAEEVAARELGILPADALTLQRLAAQALERVR